MIEKEKSYSDETLVGRLKGEDISAFEEIYRRYWKLMYSASFRRVQSREISEEFVQDIFTSLWLHRKHAKIANLRAYLFTAVKYKVINHMARETTRNIFTKEQGEIAMLRHDNSTEEAVLLDDLNNALEREIEKLPAQRQLIFRLHKKENLTMKQVASHMGISEKTAENQYGKALKVLKVNLKHFTFSLGYTILLSEVNAIL